MGPKTQSSLNIPANPAERNRPGVLEAESRIPEGFTPITEHGLDDIFVVGYPKSGNTWVQNLVAGAVYGVNIKLTSDAVVQSLIPDVGHKQFYQRNGSPVFFKSHALPKTDYRRVIYLLRDGRDVMVSYLHHIRALHTEMIDFLQLVQTGRGLYPCKWHEHVQQWLANPFRADLLVVRYEDLLKDAQHELARICEFAGLPQEVPCLKRAVRKARFAVMQQREKRLGWENPRWPKDRPFVRRGIVGSHIDEMPSDVRAAFLHDAAPVLTQLGYL